MGTTSSKPPKVIVVGIAGPSRGGKTTLMASIMNRIPDEDRQFFVCLDHFFDLEAIYRRRVDSGAEFQNWEEPEAVDWRGLREEIGRVVRNAEAKAAADGEDQIVVVEGFLLFAEPLVREFDRAVFVWADRETCRRRREETKRVPPGYFEKLIWPCHVRHNAHLLKWKEESSSGALAQLGGDLLVLDGAHGDCKAMADTALRFIRGTLPATERDLDREMELLRSTLAADGGGDVAVVTAATN